MTFGIRGLSCASCAIDVGRALRRHPGVVAINVNYVADRGYVEFDPAVTTWEGIARALSRRGYMIIRDR